MMLLHLALNRHGGSIGQLHVDSNPGWAPDAVGHVGSRAPSFLQTTAPWHLAQLPRTHTIRTLATATGYCSAAATNMILCDEFLVIIELFVVE